MYTRQAYPEQWAGTQNNLANAFRGRIRGERADNLEQAIAHCQEALAVRTREDYPEKWATTQHNLAGAYYNRIRGERAENLKQAIAHYQETLTVRTLQQFPAHFQQIQIKLGELYFGEARWREAHDAYQEALRAEKLLVASAYTETGRQAEVARTSALYGRAAFALLKLGQPGEALVRLEQGRTRLLAKALALDEVDLSALSDADRDTFHRLRQTIRGLEAELRLPPDTPTRRPERVLADELGQARRELNTAIEAVRATHPDFMPEGLDLAEILALIPKEAALVAPLVTPQGSAVFVVPAGVATVTLDHVFWLEDFKEPDLHELLRGPAEQVGLGGWLGAYFNARRDRRAWPDWLDRIEATGQELWERMLAPIAERLATLRARQILVMPQGGLGLLPLHAAWREVDGKRRYLLDEYTVTYLPSAYAHKVSAARMRETTRQGRTLFAVVNPTEDLPFTPIEGDQVTRLFGAKDTTVLHGEQATPGKVTEANASYLHFSCHGFYRWDDPMQSGLVLAHGEPLTLAQIIGQLNLEATRLVTLSACETGITDIRQSPDEYLGLPAGFLQAGAPAVVSTLWAVNDLSTMLLMERFYQLHLQDGKDLPNALQQAQTWLREITAGELAKRFAGEEEALLAKPRMSLEAASDFFARFASLHPEHQPFAHPYYWAAFTFSGV